MVRLEVLAGGVIFIPVFQFQFLVVRLEDPTEKFYREVGIFQFLVVRLEAERNKR